MTDGVQIEPMDQYNQALVADVHPPGWINPSPIPRYNLVVIGAGAGGLVTAMGAAGVGAKVALVERHVLGGDCLNVGCVPSKCLIQSGRASAAVRGAKNFGIKPGRGLADFPAVMERLRRIRSEISPNDSASRLTEAGVDVFFGDAEFLDAETLQAGPAKLRFAKAVLATGARPVCPPIEGLEDVGFHTNETIFTLTQRPRRLAVIGGGPIGCEMAQSFRRLGCKVTIVQRAAHLLVREDPEAAAIVQRVFADEGLTVMLDCEVKRATKTADGKMLRMQTEDGEKTVVVDEILVGVGRTPNVEGLALERVDVAYDRDTGIKVDDRLRTTNKRIYAVGDCCSTYKFTHAADAMARMVIRNALFMGRKKFSELVVPWCTYTDPEIAHVGLYPRQAEARGIALDTYTQPLAEVDRAVTDGQTEGFVKVHTRGGSDEILGATIVAPHAGDMISQITQAMVAGVGLGRIGGVIYPYPTQAEAIRKAADVYSRGRLTPRVKRLFGRWLAWRRR